MPRTLHGELAEAAEREGVSLNQLIVGRLSRSLGASGEAGAVGSPAAAEARTVSPTARRPESRMLTWALAVNLVVVIAAGAIALALLILAWQGGF
jgi:hypothetical protein